MGELIFMVKVLPCLLSSRLDDNLLDMILLLIKNRVITRNGTARFLMMLIREGATEKVLKFKIIIKYINIKNICFY